jgi:hypothetical protein
MTLNIRDADTVEAHATRLLTDLGRTREEVAAALELGGHHGSIEDCGACPVAVYLLRSDLDVPEVAVAPFEIALVFPFGTVYVDVPTPVSKFILWFDQGAFPALLPQPVLDAVQQVTQPKSGGR